MGELRPRTQAAPLTELERMAEYAVKSGLFGLRRKEEAVALMLLAQAEGLHPFEALRRYHIIQGRPAMRADAMLAAFMANGGRVEWVERSPEAVEAIFRHPQGGEAKVRWTLEDAKRAGLAAREMWQKYPRQMLTARVISEGIRLTAPGVVTGIYTTEEVVDIALDEGAQVTALEEGARATGPAEPEPTDAIPRAIEAPDAKKNPWNGLADAIRELGLSSEVARELACLFVGRDVKNARDLSPQEARALGEYLARVVEVAESADVDPILAGEQIAAAVQDRSTVPSLAAIEEAVAAASAGE